MVAHKHGLGFWKAFLGLGLTLGLNTTGLPVQSVEIDRGQVIQSMPMAAMSGWDSASFPVENFVEYTSRFGPRAGGYHYGLDLAAPYGSYIRNWWAGQVVEVWEDNRCGTGVVIESGYWEHIYCHVQGRVGTHQGRPYLMDQGGGILLWEGQMVNTGDRIARVGMTGRTSGPHLHWGLKYAGQWVDPSMILLAMSQSRVAGR
jgi:murein DD-endopeptidase MepM/ murein hydrolase activator NlpD